MESMENQALCDYLAGVEKPAAVVEVSASLPVGVDPMERLLAGMIAVGILAKDLHYRSCGKPFYSIHELADIVWDVRSKCDELIETYYLGDKGQVPPPMWKIHESGVRAARIIFNACTDEGLLRALKETCEKVSCFVEDAKELPVRSGVHSVLDDISKRLLTAAGLLGRTIACAG